MNKNNGNDPRKKFRKAKLQDKEYRLPIKKKYYDTFDMIQLFSVTERTLQRWRTEGPSPTQRWAEGSITSRTTSNVSCAKKVRTSIKQMIFKHRKTTAHEVLWFFYNPFCRPFRGR